MGYQPDNFAPSKNSDSSLDGANGLNPAPSISLLYMDAYKDALKDQTKNQTMDQPSTQKKVWIDENMLFSPIDKSTTDAPLEGFPKSEDWFSGDRNPSAKDRSDAANNLEKGISKLIPEADRETMKSLTSAIANGDAKAFGEALKKVAGDPEKLKNMTEEINKLMESKNCSTKLHVTANGHVIVADGFGGSAASFDPVTGKASVKDVEHRLDGTLRVKPDEVVGADAQKLFANVGDRAVSRITNDQKFENKLLLGLVQEKPFQLDDRPNWKPERHESIKRLFDDRKH